MIIQFARVHSVPVSGLDLLQKLIVINATNNLGRQRYVSEDTRARIIPRYDSRLMRNSAYVKV